MSWLGHRQNASWSSIFSSSSTKSTSSAPPTTRNVLRKSRTGASPNTPPRPRPKSKSERRLAVESFFPREQEVEFYFFPPSPTSPVSPPAWSKGKVISQPVAPPRTRSLEAARLAQEMQPPRARSMTPTTTHEHEPELANPAPVSQPSHSKLTAPTEETAWRTPLGFELPLLPKDRLLDHPQARPVLPSVEIPIPRSPRSTPLPTSPLPLTPRSQRPMPILLSPTPIRITHPPTLMPTHDLSPPTPRPYSIQAPRPAPVPPLTRARPSSTASTIRPTRPLRFTPTFLSPTPLPLRPNANDDHP